MTDFLVDYQIQARDHRPLPRTLPFRDTPTSARHPAGSKIVTPWIRQPELVLRGCPTLRGMG